MYIIKTKGLALFYFHIETRERKTEREFTQKETLKKGLRERERERGVYYNNNTHPSIKII